MAKDTSAKETVNMDDFESLLATLSAEDLENINDLVDPEVCERIFSSINDVFLPEFILACR